MKMKENGENINNMLNAWLRNSKSILAFMKKEIKDAKRRRLEGKCLESSWAVFNRVFMNNKATVIRQKGESQNGCFKKAKHAKFSEKRTFFTPWYAHTRSLLSWNTRFEIRPFALLLTKRPSHTLKSRTCFFITFVKKFIIQITWNSIFYHWHASPAINYSKLLLLFSFKYFPYPSPFPFSFDLVLMIV